MTWSADEPVAKWQKKGACMESSSTARGVNVTRPTKQNDPKKLTWSSI